MADYDALVPHLETAKEGIQAATENSEGSTLEILDKLELIQRAVADAEAAADRYPETSGAFLGPLSRMSIAATEALELLQAQDIITQRLAHVRAIIEQVETYLGDPEAEALAEVAPADADPNATTTGRVDRQSVADDIFG